MLSHLIPVNEAQTFIKRGQQMSPPARSRVLWVQFRCSATDGDVCVACALDIYNPVIISRIPGNRAATKPEIIT